MAEPIRVTGLREFTRSVRALDAGMAKTVRLALNEAVNIVIDYARPRVESRTGRAARSIRAASSQQQARVSAGGRRAPYYPWLDFGGRVGAQRQVSRPFYKEGRYLYKGLVVKRDAVTQAMAKSLTQVATSAGLEVS